jgi:hypothetical protein
MTPAQVTASLKRCGVPASQELQQLIALQLLIGELTQQVGNLARSAKALEESAAEMQRQQRDAE